MLNNLPRPLVIGVAVVAAILAIIIIFRTTTGKGENGDRPSKEEIINMQKQGAGQGRSQTNGH